ncbi:MAG: AraC family transcriptional regulator ligand-binding domain-containing protein [Moraxellaceae bacterium]|nr:AraC family transcriptional regulator ligand-binding domain-containing protein [Moraxellaceae bacterium]
MQGGFRVASALAGMLHNFMAAESLHLPALQARMAAWPAQGSITYEEWHEALRKLASAVPRPGVGLDVARHITPAALGTLGHLVLTAATYGDALLYLHRFHRLSYDGNPPVVSLYGDSVTIAWNVEFGQNGALLDIVGLGVFVTISAQLAGPEWQPREISLVRASPEELAYYRAFFSCPVNVGAGRPSVRFGFECMQLPVVGSEPSRRAALEAQALAELAALPPQDDLMAQLQQALRDGVRNGNHSAGVVARQLNLSLRSLQRRLAERGVVLSDVLDGVRAEMACEYLADPERSLSETALQLGFSEQSAFNRAFRRWFGMTPSEFRASGGR